jgi:DMSO/TMAO reductase YedYZ heme-binding membrane subunit
MLLAATDKAWWDIARTGGLVAFVLLTAAVLLGLLLGGDAERRRLRPQVAEWHRLLTLLAYVFLAGHVLALLVGNAVPFSLADVLIPFHSSYRTGSITLGVIALELLVALAVAESLRRHMTAAVSVWVEVLTVVVWLLSLLHATLSGSDGRRPLVTLLYVVSAALVAGVCAWRLLETYPIPERAAREPKPKRERPVAPPPPPPPPRVREPEPAFVHVPQADGGPAGLPRAYLGAALRPDVQGVRVTAVMPDSPAALAGLGKDGGDVIVAIDGREVGSPEALTAALAGYDPGDRVVLGVQRDGRQTEVAVRLGLRLER